MATFAAPATAENPRYGRMTLGELTVIVLSDGYHDIESSVFVTPTAEQATALKLIYPGGRAHNSLNVVLVQSRQGILLVDTGGGKLLGPNVGGLQNVLATLGVTPESVSHVILTHAHRDHIGGLAHQGRAAFPRAQVYISKAEHAFWSNPQNEGKVPERTRGTFTALRDMLGPYAGRVTMVDPGQEVFPGVKILDAHGHTPGHIAVLLESKGQRLLIWGDLLHGLELQTAQPQIATTFDVNPVEAAAFRSALLARAVQENWLVTGVHVPQPDVYSLRPAGKGFSAQPQHINR